MQSNTLCKFSEPPSSGEEFIKFVQLERNQLPEWTRCAVISEAVSSMPKEQLTLVQMADPHLKDIPNHFLPTSIWIENSLKRAAKVREKIAVQYAEMEGTTSLSIPTIQSKKDQYKSLFSDYSGNSVQVVPRLSQPIVLRFLKHLGEWIETCTISMSSSSTSVSESEAENPILYTQEDYKVLSKSLLEHLQWIYFLLCKCDPLLEADDLYTIRTLCKTLIKKRSDVLIIYVSLPQEGMLEEEDLEEGEERETKLDPVFVGTVKKTCKIRYAKKMNKSIIRTFSCFQRLLYPRIARRLNDTTVESDSEVENKVQSRNTIGDSQSDKPLRMESIKSKSYPSLNKSFNQSSNQKKLNGGQANQFEEERPIFPEKSWKSLQESRVNFNLKKLKSLSGMEKVELFRDYLKTKSTSEAVYVYETIFFNGIGNQLVYKDHHNLFRLLLKDPLRYKEIILKIRHEMIQNSLLPTEYFLNEYLCCCIKWGELNSATQIVDECIRDKLAVSVQSLHELLRCYEESNVPEMWRKGISLYEKLIHSPAAVKPSAQIYIQVMNLFTKLDLKEKVAQVYFEAEENMERLVHLQSKRMNTQNESDLDVWRANTHTQLFNAYLYSFLENPQKVKEEYVEFANSGILKIAAKAASNTFNLLLKSLEFVQLKTERKEYLDFYRCELKKNQVKASYLHYSLMIEYSNDSENIKTLYKYATTNGGARIPPSKLSHLDTSFISALTDIDPQEGFDALQQVHQRIGLDLDAKKPMRFVYQKLIEKFRSMGNEENAAIVESLLYI